MSSTSPPLIESGGDVILESLRRVRTESRPHTIEALFVYYYPDERPLAAVVNGVWETTDLAGTVLAECVGTETLSVPGGDILTMRRQR